MRELRVPTQRIAVQLVTTRGACRNGHLHLGPSHFRSGEVEDLGEVLNDEREFLPFEAEGDGAAPLVVHKAHIARVSVAGAVAAALDVGDEPHTLILADGSALSGRVCVPTPPTASRLVDKLNRAPRFVPVQAEDALHFVQVDHIVEVE
jgi:hypothetical protein